MKKMKYPLIWLQLVYFVSLSLLGLLALKLTRSNTITPNLDLFFTSVSAVTVSSMSTLEMEVFSNAQLLFLTILMFLGGEVFTSLLGLLLMRPKIFLHRKTQSGVELGTSNHVQEEEDGSKCITTLTYLVSFYLIVIHAVGSTLISVYLTLVPAAAKALKTKHISLQTFSVFTTVSTFANCGFVPTNENMVVFRENSGLLLILIPQIVLGNTLYPVFLRLLILLMEKATKKEELRYMLKNPKEVGYEHLFSGIEALYLGMSVIGFIVVQMVVLCSLEWNSASVSLSVYSTVVASLFQVVNSRHAGESVFDLSLISPAILVIFVFMMYLPPYTSYRPIENISESESERKGGKNNGFVEAIYFSQLTYLLIFIILICITERHNLKNDPLNFNVLNIVFEVISAYGNVGFSVGYSCERRINPNSHCTDAWNGFVGRWSNAGKFVLIVVMFFGRFKKFTIRGGTAWILT